MSVKKVAQIICDRCGKVVADTDSTNHETKPPMVYAEGSILTDATKIHFVDLCTKCVARVQTLLGQIRLDESAKGDDAKPAVGDNAASPKADPSAPTAT